MQTPPGFENILLYKGIRNSPTWIFVFPYHAGSLPSASSGKGSWIRLDSIKQVEAHASLAVGSDESQHEYAIQVFADKCYNASDELFKKAEALKIVEAIMHSVTECIMQFNKG